MGTGKFNPAMDSDIPPGRGPGEVGEEIPLGHLILGTVVPMQTSCSQTYSNTLLQLNVSERTLTDSIPRHDPKT